MKNRPKQIIYRYNGDAKTEEVEDDFHGDTWHKDGDRITRNGKKWKVVAINDETTAAGPMMVPVHRVFLKDAL